MDIQALYQLYLQYPSIQTDTRKLQAGDMFFALKGPHFNGNAFAAQALDAGASYVVMDEADLAVSDRCLLVADVLSTLQQLARYHRDQLKIPVIAITGSNGKTTTKELIREVLTAQYHTYATEGNLNNHIGVPLTLLRIRPTVQIAVIEMGANHLKEIEQYCKIANPTHGLITNCGKAHLEGFGSIEGVRQGKGELFDHLRAHKGTAFVCKDFDYFKKMSKGIAHIIWYGSQDSDVNGKIVSSDPFLTVDVLGMQLHTQLAGDYNFYNVMAAVTVGQFFKVPPEKIKNAIEQYEPANNRSQVMQRNSNTIILDAYNANPSSMKAAIENFARLNAEKKILLLGAMMELGKESLQEHQALVALLERYHWDHVVLVGGDFAKVKHPFIFKENAEQAREWLQKQQFHHAHFLIKGSRSMQMERVVND